MIRIARLSRGSIPASVRQLGYARSAPGPGAGRGSHGCLFRAYHSVRSVSPSPAAQVRGLRMFSRSLVSLSSPSRPFVSSRVSAADTVGWAVAQPSRLVGGRVGGARARTLPAAATAALLRNVGCGSTTYRSNRYFRELSPPRLRRGTSCEDDVSAHPAPILRRREGKNAETASPDEV